jgi:hypothetical protein
MDKTAFNKNMDKLSKFSIAGTFASHGAAAVAFTLMLTLVIGACSTTPDSLSNSEISQILKQFDRQSEQLRLEREASRQLGIHQVSIENPTAPIHERLVTVSLENAYLDAVIDRLSFNYTLDDISKLNGRVTAEFTSLPMADALAALLNPNQLQANFGNDLVTIGRMPEVPLAMDAEDDYVFRKRVMRFADTRSLEPILYTLLSDGSSDDSDDDDDDDDDDYGFGDDSDGSSDGSGDGSSAPPSKDLTYTAIHAENAIVLKGPSSDVRNALEILKAVDTDTGHIMIEATVIEFSVNDLLQIGTRISGGASGNFSDVSLDWASLVGETISFQSVSGAANTRAFQAAISLLLLNEQARIMARPYMAAIPGYQAVIDVAEDRYITTFTENSGDVTLEPVTSGVTMTMTPFLLPDDQIRMDMAISVSQFVPTLDNVQLARSRSDASSTMRIGSGETLVIGGLMAEQSSKSSAGVPGARSIPGLGFLFGESKDTAVQRRVLVYLTPYIWEPGMDTPNGASAEIHEFIKTQTMFDSED